MFEFVKQYPLVRSQDLVTMENSTERGCIYTKLRSTRPRSEHALWTRTVIRKLIPRLIVTREDDWVSCFPWLINCRSLYKLRLRRYRISPSWRFRSWSSKLNCSRTPTNCTVWNSHYDSSLTVEWKMFRILSFANTFWVIGFLKMTASRLSKFFLFTVNFFKKL